MGSLRAAPIPHLCYPLPPSPLLPISTFNGFQKTFLLDLLRKNLRGDEESTAPGLRATLCCCFVGLLHMIWQSTLLIILRVAWGALTTWFRSCWAASCATCCDNRSSKVLSDIESGREKGGSRGRSFIFVEFNAWEYARSEVLWAALISKIFDAVSLARCHIQSMNASLSNSLISDEWWAGYFPYFSPLSAPILLSPGRSRDTRTLARELCVLHA